MKIMVAVPCMDMMHSDFVIALTGLQHDGNVAFVYSKSSLVYDSRNGLAKKAIDGGFDRVLWLDSDMWFSPDLLQKLSADIDSGCDIVSGLYVTRKPPFNPVIYDDCGLDVNEANGTATPRLHPFIGYPQNAVFEVEACGFGGVMVKTSILAEVIKKYGLPFSPVMGFGEDISFCLRVKELGKKIFCDSRIKMGHVGYRVYTEDDLHE